MSNIFLKESSEKIIDQINAPPEIKNKAIIDSNNILQNKTRSKSVLINDVKNLIMNQYRNSLKNYDEFEYYDICDVAYNVYLTLLSINKYSDNFCWAMANIFLYNGILKTFTNQINNIQYNEIIDSIIENPKKFVLKECIFGAIQLIASLLVAYNYEQIALNAGFLLYLTLVMCNLYRLSDIYDERNYIK